MSMKSIPIDLQNPRMAEELVLALSSVRKGVVADLTFGGEACYPNRIVPILAIADDYRRHGGIVEISALPGSYTERVCGPFASGAMSPEDDKSIKHPFDRVWSFSSAAGQYAIFNAMLVQLTKSAVLGAGVKESFMWCLNEVMDNVLNHSSPGQEPHGYVMVQYHRKTNSLTVCVFDLGIGLKASLENSVYRTADPYQAILSVMKAGVTSGNGQGNGLWGLRELLSRADGGSLQIASGGAAHRFSPCDGVDKRVPSLPLPDYPGTTLVDFQLKCGEAIDFDNVFGPGHEPVDLQEEAMETEDGAVRLKVSEIAKGTGSRESAREVRNMVENILDNDRKRVVLDFADVSGCSSSFADELIGKLLVRYGFLAFTQAVSLEHVQGISAQMVNRSIAQRLSSGAPDKAIDGESTP